MKIFKERLDKIGDRFHAPRRLLARWKLGVPAPVRTAYRGVRSMVKVAIGKRRPIPGLRLVAYHPSMLQQVLTVWNAALGEQFPLTSELFVQNGVRDPHVHPDACWLAMVPGYPAAVGLCVAKIVREPLGADGWLPQEGWVSLLAVHPAYQRRGIGTALLAGAERYLRKQRRTVVTLGGDPNNFLPGVPAGEGAAAFFRASGYALVEDVYDLRRTVSLAAALTEERSLRVDPDLAIRPLAPEDAPRLLAFLDEVFPGRWRYIVDRFLRLGGPLSDIMGVVHADQVVGFALLFHPGSRCIGPSIAWTRGVGRRAGGIGPIGLAPSFRGRGLGLALLGRSVGHLARLGVEEVVVDWTDLLGFYGRWGFTVWRRYRQGAKRV